MYARNHKRGGAWMDECQNRRYRSDGADMIAQPATAQDLQKPAHYTHDEVITLFHEFGHGLHHAHSGGCWRCCRH